jgi:hypothetical protein
MSALIKRTKCYYGDKVEEDEMGGTCSIGGIKMCKN